MRLLNSVCKVIAEAFPNIPIEIREVPQYFSRPSFLVTRVTNSKEINNINIYSKHPTFQIVYFGERDEANQVLAEKLYEAEEVLDNILLLPLAIPILPKNDSEKIHKRYAKIGSFSSSLRLDEGAIYCNLVLDFTDSTPTREGELPTVEEIDLSISRENN